MKKKLNFSKAGIKQLALVHGEKAVFALGVLIFATFVYAFFGRVILPAEKGPKRLEESAVSAEAHIVEEKWGDADQEREGLAVADYVKRAKHVALIPAGYALKTPLDMPVKPASNKRGQPALLAVESLQATGGQGPFALKVDKDTETHGQRWVMLVGLVPVKKQAAVFDEVFKESIPIAEVRPSGGAKRDAEAPRDAPVYAKEPIVERAEVIAGKEGELEWKPVDTLKIFEMQEAWGAKTPEIVSREFIDQVYTKPLGPLVSGEWGNAAAHPPQIPLATETERLKKEKLELKAKEKHARDLAARAKGAAPQPGADRRPGRSGTLAPTNPQDGISGDRQAEETNVEYRLFRFLDLTVEANTRYRYRVRLVTLNPNYNLPEKFLQKKEFRDEPILDTPWSEASPIVEIPRGEGFLVGEPKPPGKGLPPADPPATLLVYTVEPTTGLEAAVERQVYRGSVLNFTASVDMFNPGSKKSLEKQVEFNTGALVLDIRGGRYFAGMTRDNRVMEPCEVLLFDGESRLEAHSELDEVEDFKKHAPKDKDAVVQKPRGPQPPAPAPAVPGRNVARPPRGGTTPGGNLLDGPVARPATGTTRSRTPK